MENSFIVTFYRIIKSGCLNFWRNKWLSSATVLVMSLTLLVMLGLLFLNVTANYLLDTLQNKIDISVYFKPDVAESDILKIKTQLAKLNEVKDVEYVSRDDALKRFKEKHSNNQVIMESLNELDKNPLNASLNIKAQMVDQYESIVRFLETPVRQKLIDKVNYKENKQAIIKLSYFTRTSRRSGTIISLALALITILVAFNTIRLAIYNSREEIGVMRLVGASNWFIRGPFIIEGILYGIIAAFLTLAIAYPVLLWLSPKLNAFLPDTDLLYYFQVNFWSIFGLLIGVGMILGGVSSLVAIRRYLNV